MPQTGAGRLELLMSHPEANKKIASRIRSGAMLVKRRLEAAGDVEEATAAFGAWDAYNVELLLSMFTAPECANDYGRIVDRPRGTGRAPYERLDYLQVQARAKLERLKAIKQRLPLIHALHQRPRSTAKLANPPGTRVFVVHGHNAFMREAVAHLALRLGLAPIVLADQAEGGRTIIEKFEANADVGFAVILLTGDDVGAPKAKPKSMRPRARQNVVFEWGFFVGALRRERVCALYEPGVELPSDLHGIAYIEIDRGGAWKLKLAKEFQAAQLPVNMNAV